jgi:hypothetical protein
MVTTVGGVAIPRWIDLSEGDDKFGVPLLRGMC